MKSSRDLVLLTERFPGDSVTEGAFISPEIMPLAESFRRVIIVPLVGSSIINDAAMSALPENVIVAKELIPSRGTSDKIKGTLAVRKDLPKAFAASGCSRRELAYGAYVGMSKRGIERIIREYQLDLSNTLFYTFWFGFQTAALSLIPGAKFVTRAHGYDIYEGSYSYISPYWRTRTFEKISGCFTASKAGADYLRQRYPRFSSLIEERYLGCENAGRLNPADADDNGTFVIYGCARLSPEKGVVEQIKALKEVAAATPDKKFRYIHVGDGVLREAVENEIETLPDNLKIELKGRMENRDIHAILQSRHIDAALLLSKSEGCPIMICECLSYGIPVIGTNVGGIPETLAEGAGILLKADYTPAVLKQALKQIKESSKTYRTSARTRWQNKFNAPQLRQSFARTLTQLSDEGES